MGAATTKFYVVERGLIRESHIISHGGQDLTLNASRALGLTVAVAEERKRKYGLSGEGPASTPGASLPAGQAGADLKKSFELSLAPTVSELTRTISSWEVRTNQTLSTLVLTGGAATLRGLKEFMQGKVQTEIRLSDPFAKTQAPAFLEAILKDAGPEFSVAVGLALRRLQEIG
jgi:Tfp pilus assembly PilM family ATPase